MRPILLSAWLALVAGSAFARPAGAHPEVRIEGRSFLIGAEPLRQFTLFAASLRDEETLRRIFRGARSLGYNCARVGSETSDWEGEGRDGHRLFRNLRGPPPGSEEQIRNLDRVVRVAAEEAVALEVVVIFTIKERPIPEQIAHARRTASRLRDEPHVFFSAVNEPWVHSILRPRNVNRLLQVIQKAAPRRPRGVDEQGELAPEFRYDASRCDYVAYHWSRDPGWEKLPGLRETVARWDKPVLLNETMCYQSREEERTFGAHPLCRAERAPFVEMMKRIYHEGAYGCFHSVWGIRSEHVGFAPDLRGTDVAR